MKTRRDPAAKAGSLLFALFAQFIINRKRGWWKAFLDSTGRGLLGYSRPVAFSKCRLAHFYGKIAAVGWHFTCPPGAMEEVFHVFTAPDQRFLPILQIPEYTLRMLRSIFCHRSSRMSSVSAGHLYGYLLC